MKEYFTLQFKMANRKLEAYGLEPALGYLLISAGFAGLSLFLFYKTEFAPYILMLISLALTSKLSERRRNDFLKICFVAMRYKLIRMIENFLSIIPFLIVLLYKHNYLGSLILAVISLLFALSSFKTNLSFTIPTPFYKKPFEFTVGFRNTFLIFPLAYILTAIAISVDNYNLGIFSLILIFLAALSFYPQPENEYFVWSFALSPKKFILEKAKTALVFTSVLSLPVILSLCFFYYGNIYALAAFYIGGCLLLITVIFAKYAAYPNEMNMPEGIIIALCMSFPPLLLVSAPYFYIRATTKLQRYLA